MDLEDQSNSIIYEGSLILRYAYPDGRVTALISVGPDWQVEVFPSKTAAMIFAKEHNLKFEEMPSDPSGGT